MLYIHIDDIQWAKRLWHFIYDSKTSKQKKEKKKILIDIACRLVVIDSVYGSELT